MAPKSSKKPASADTARKIWLAGIGAYGRAFSEAQESFARLSGESSRVFDDLVAKGEAIEQTVEERGRKIVAKVAPSALSVDERIRRMRDRLGLGEEGHAAKSASLGEISERLARIEEKIDRLLKQTHAVPASKPATKRKTPAKKKS